MQVISSPTRKEVDIAHQKGRWLDVGIPSMRNLRGISWMRIVMWSILALSSIPLHLMFVTPGVSLKTATNISVGTTRLYFRLPQRTPMTV